MRRKRSSVDQIVGVLKQTEAGVGVVEVCWQLFNSSEKRLARALLLLARYGRADESERMLPKIPQETLAEMIGTTRSRVNFFMNKFKKMGFIKYNDMLHVNTALLGTFLRD